MFFLSYLFSLDLINILIEKIGFFLLFNLKHTKIKFLLLSVDMLSHLVSNIRRRNIIVDFNRMLVVNEQIHNIGESGRHPATSLVVELIEPFRAVRVGV